MKFPGGNPLLFCEQVSTVTSFFEQWNDCERTVVLYALLKRVPFANLKFLQLSIDYNLAQNYSTQSKLQLLETHANNANFLNKLVQRYQTSGDVVVPASTPNGQLTISDSGFQEISTSSTTDKKNSSSSSTFDLSSGSSASSTTSSSSSTSTSSTDPAKNGSEKAPSSTTESTSPAVAATTTPTTTTESKKDILNDMLTYLPLLKPGNDDVKSVYMSLIPAAVEDACQRAVPTELVQHILSYLLIHPAVNNDDRRSLSYWLRHLEEHIASTYIPTTLATPSATANNNNNNNNTNSSNSKLASVNNNNNNYYTPNNHHHNSHHQQTSKPGSQQSLQFLAATATAAPWHHLHPQQQQNQHPVAPAAIGSSSSSSLLSISNSSLLSKSQQSLNQSIGGGAGPGGGGSGGGGGSSTSSSSSGLDSGASQLKTAGSGSSNSSISISAASANNSSSSTTASTMMVNLDWTTSTQQAVVAEVCGGSGGGGDGKVLRGSMENVTLKEFGPVTFSYARDHQLSSQAAAPPSSSQTLNGGTSANNSSSGGGGPGALNGSVATSVLADLDSSSDDNHLSFSKNGTEIFDYDCDYDNEEEFYNLARAAAAAAAASIPVAATGTAAAGSVVTPGGVGTGGKNRVSFDANISDYLRVPPIGDLELDGSGLLKTRRSNSLTTTVSSGCGLAGVGEQLHHQQKQNNECLSAENLSQLMQNKPRSFSLTMESPRSSLTSSGSETRLDDFKQHHHMMKMYGTAPNVGMASIAHWLKSLRLHKYVWLFSNLTYEQMMEMTEEYLASLGVTKGARHKLVLCIQKLRERYATMVRLEKELLAAGGGVASKAQLGAVFEELTNIVLTPIKPAGTDPKEDIGTQFLKLLDLIASILLVRAAASPQDEEYLNVYCWLLERAMHNEAFSGHVIQLKEYKYKANKVKMQYAPKGGSHYGKSSGGGGLGGSGGGLGVGLGGGGSGGERGIPMNGNLGKPRWSVSNKHNKPCGGSSEGLQKSAPHRKSSLQYFSSPMQSNQQNPTPGSGNSSATHLQAIPPHGYYGASAGGTGHNNSYNKSSSYPNFASNLSGGGDSVTKHHRPPPQHVALGGHQSQQQQQQVPPPPQQQPPHVPPHGTNFMYHRHSLNNISAHQHQQQFLQQLQQSQQQQQSQLLPSIYLTTMGGVPGGGKKEVPVPKEQHHHQQKSDDSGKSQNNNNNSIGDINSRLEFLCLQMTEQAIN